MIEFDDNESLWRKVERDLKSPVLPHTRQYYEKTRHLLIREVLDGYEEDSYGILLDDVQGFQKAAQADYGGLGVPPEANLMLQQPALFPRYNQTIALAAKPVTEALTNGQEPTIDRQSILSVLLALKAHEIAAIFRRKHLDGLLHPSEVNAWIDLHATTPGRIDDADDQALIEMFRTGIIDSFDPCQRVDRAEKGTVLHDLATVLHLLDGVTPWAPSQATWFVLTGEVPPAPRIKVRFEGFMGQSDTSWSHIQMDIDPEATHDEVTNAYRKARDKLRAGVRSRSVEKRKLSLVAFVLENAQSDRTGITNWDDLRRLWNNLSYVVKKEWDYFSTPTMRTDYHEALDLVQPRLLKL